MTVRPDDGDRPELQSAVLRALVGRSEEGMTVFELRSRVDAGIDDLEDALSELNDEGLVDVEDDGDRTVIVPVDRVVPADVDEDGDSILEELRRKLPF